MNSKISVCLEVSQNYRPKAEYSIRMLLNPLGLGPVFKPRNELDEPGIYYGNHPSGLHSRVIILPIASESEIFFDAPKILPLTSIKWKRYAGTNIPILFSSEKGEDLVASTFYWLSGWQEYTVRNRDQHGRFPHEASLQSALEVTYVPVVDYYRKILQEKLAASQIHANFRSWAGKRWAFCPTIDIDYLRHWRLGMIFREKVLYFLLNRRKVNITARWHRLFQFIKSYVTPGDAFQVALSRMHQQIQPYGSATVFLKTGAHGPNDVYYKLDQPFLQNIIHELQSDNFEIGLHPSYHAHSHPGYLRSERRALASLIGESPASVRQHYLRYEPEITPYIQMRSGFKIDSSLGFAECAGFRNGTCMPFLKFNCIRNETMDLWEMPLLMMDGALFNRQKYTTSQAIKKSIDLLKLCKEFGGVGVALWHNVIGEEMDHSDWGDHFERVMQWSREQDAYIGTLRDALASWTGYSYDQY